MKEWLASAGLLDQENFARESLDDGNQACRLVRRFKTDMCTLKNIY